MQNTLKRSTELIKLTKEVKFPQKFKGTIIEKWANYWKNLFIDYRQMLIDLRTDIQDEPKKAIKWSTGLVLAYYFSLHNPSEIEFKDQLKRIENEVILVGDSCRNPKAAEYVRFIERSYNERIMRHRTLGLFSVMYVMDYDDRCDLYKAHCKYTQPTYLNFLNRIVDVGFLGKWWNLHIKTTNFDINE